MNRVRDLVIHTYPRSENDLVNVYTCTASSKQEADAFFRHFEFTFKPQHYVAKKALKHKMVIPTNTEEWLANREAGFVIHYRARRRFFYTKSKYQTIEIIENGIFGKMLFLNGEMQIAERHDEIYFDTITEPLREVPTHLMKDIVILGGGSGGVLRRLLDMKPEKVFVVDIDEEVIGASHAHLENVNSGAFDAKNVEIVINDATTFLDDISNDVDAVIYDLTDRSFLITEFDSRTFLDATFSGIKNSLRGGGIVSMHCCSEFDGETLQIFKATLSKYFTNIAFRKVFIPSFCEHWVFASAEKPLS